MNYAEQLRNKYFKNKDRIAAHRNKIGLCAVLTLEDELKDGYEAYKIFCRSTGKKPKNIIEFLKTEVI